MYTSNGAFLKVDLEKNVFRKTLVVIPAGCIYYAENLRQPILRSTVFCFCLWQSLSQLAHALCDDKLEHSSLVQVFWPKTRFV